jgi:hypothetical protein
MLLPKGSAEFQEWTMNDLSQNLSDPGRGPKKGQNSKNLPQHYTREPWWVVLVAGAVTALVPLFLAVRSLMHHGDLRELPGGNAVSLLTTMVFFSFLGMAAAGMLILRSHVKSVALANTVLWLGILLVAVGASFAAMLFMGF